MDINHLVNKKLNFRKPAVDFSDLSDTIRCQILEIKNERLIVQLSNDLDLTSGKLVQMVYIDNAQGIYYFNTEIVSVEMPLIKLKLPNKIQNYQRRQFVRVEYQTEIEFSPVSYQGENLTHLEDKKGHGQMIDISGGGICFKSDIKLLEELVIDLRFRLNENDFEILGEVVRVLKKGDEYEIGIKFDILSSKVEDQISNFVLQQQIKNRRRKLVVSE
ncbi:flagellar brake protein [Selenihalanaerobacter shriftii]|uniref:C-di-GMP-binding flagellar brake protein YcgR, contains PilZNR and PilZ domains n=1 Tax=Selenihalanaerobacter shriftii TaxID=142842 RepID=A0A1T4JUY7_9FIRM|nr:PilZ domain-containing protein [Selenihalanaerobacter shriftii]SJZ33953.1 c-di-GMP-binding flagellar brake protein YcgR, contains PilZNR and PilZ domains [Selenihalanaerobacter shriftii]